MVILGVIWKIGLSSTTMKVIKDNKGGSKLCGEGEKSSNSTSIPWECSQRNAFSCKCCVYTDLEVKQLLSVTEHSHDPDRSKVKAAKVEKKQKKQDSRCDQQGQTCNFSSNFNGIKRYQSKKIWKNITEGDLSYSHFHWGGLVRCGFCPTLMYVCVTTNENGMTCHGCKKTNTNGEMI